MAENNNTIMDEIWTINNIPLRDTAARQRLDALYEELGFRARIDHHHDSTYAKVKHTHDEYLTEQEGINLFPLKVDLDKYVLKDDLDDYVLDIDLDKYALDTDLSKYLLKANAHEHFNKGVLDEITREKLNEWNNKSGFSGNYNDLTNKPIIPSIDGLATKEELNQVHSTLLNIILALQAQVDKLAVDVHELKNPTIVVYPVTYNLQRCTSSTNTATVEKGKSFNTTITANVNYEIDNVTVTMGGTNITNQCITNTSNSVIINIANVTGNIVITVNTVLGRIACTGISLYNTTVRFYEIGATIKNIVSVSPANTTDTVVWASTNTNIATVDQTGRITAKAEGQCTITATCGSKVASCIATVDLDIPCTGVSISHKTLALNKGATYALNATVTPSDTTQSLTWSSSNTNIATVGKSGVVTGLNVGNCTIKATCGSYSANCAVTISDIKCTAIAFSVSSISIPASSSSRDLKSYLILTPKNTTEPVTWYCDNTEVRLSADGLFTPTKVGAFKVQARCGTGGEGGMGYAATLDVIVI